MKTRTSATFLRTKTRASKVQDGENVDVLSSPAPEVKNLSSVSWRFWRTCMKRRCSKMHIIHSVTRCSNRTTSKWSHFGRLEFNNLYFWQNAKPINIFSNILTIIVSSKYRFLILDEIWKFEITYSKDTSINFNIYSKACTYCYSKMIYRLTKKWSGHQMVTSQAWCYWACFLKCNESHSDRLNVRSNMSY